MTKAEYYRAAIWSNHAAEANTDSIHHTEVFSEEWKMIHAGIGLHLTNVKVCRDMAHNIPVKFGRKWLDFPIYI